MRGVVVLFCLAVLQLVGCAFLGYMRPLFDNGCTADYRDDRYYSYPQTDFMFRQKWTTPKGIQVDDSGRLTPAQRVTFGKAADAAVDEVSRCTGVKIQHCGLRLKLAEQQILCGGHWLFPCHDPKVKAHDDLGVGCGGCWDTVEFPATMVLPDDADHLGHAIVHAALHLDHGEYDADKKNVPWQFVQCGDGIEILENGEIRQTVGRTAMERGFVIDQSVAEVHPGEGVEHLVQWFNFTEVRCTMDAADDGGYVVYGPECDEVVNEAIVENIIHEGGFSTVQSF